MKVKIFEFHGKPIEEADRKKAQTILSDAMDALEEEIGKCTPDNAVEYQSRLASMVDKQIEAFPISKEFTISTPEDVSRIVQDMGSAVTFCVEDDELIGYIAAGE